MTIKNLALSFAFVSVAGGTWADDTATVQNFYDLLSNPASQDHVAAFEASISDDWESIGDYSGSSKSSDAFLGQIGGFGKLIPDLEWSVQAMY
ncbi:hypothetical protein Q5Y75_21560 [Ruegeria sp. 2205SS24-7]|uniref:hypothetical protein n=1 Tax=Ruegeria discodermiae TaxID=3064389 RepID=UPI00274188B5|nr:hypothetical protein [Ruegeria sp. 2205SS24-7]MDP5219817.1 hypothetical protein [Ruegeria sp. 2205SS24-7]